MARQSPAPVIPGQRTTPRAVLSSGGSTAHNKDVRTVLRSGLNSAVGQELLDRNVAQPVQIPKQRERKLVPWTSEEARRFLESARSDSDPLYAACVLVLALGLRKGEVLGLAWDSVNFDTCARPSARTSPSIRDLRKRKPRLRCLALNTGHRDGGTEDKARTAGRGARGSRRDLAETKDVPSLIFTGRYALHLIRALSTGNSSRVARRRACVRSLFMMRGTHVPHCSST